MITVALFQGIWANNRHFRNESFLNITTDIINLKAQPMMEITKDFRGEVLGGISGQR